MTRQHIAEQLMSLEQIVQSSTGGLTINDIEAYCEFALHRRTLQRRLETLVKANRIQRIIRPHCTRYFPQRGEPCRGSPETKGLEIDC